eukprot:1588715-Pleurochrysis_carterae.AAC.1
MPMQLAVTKISENPDGMVASGTLITTPCSIRLIETPKEVLLAGSSRRPYTRWLEGQFRYAESSAT